MWISPVPKWGKIWMNTSEEGTASEIRAPHCTMGFWLGGSPCKSKKLVKEEKQEMLKWITIETG